MEVHHHPDLPHGARKKFKEYVLEFLMIFLAVSLGFFAESIREHISERSKEREYIKGFISNVEDDTAQIREVIDFNLREIKGLDSFLQLSKKNFDEPANRRLFYHFSLKYFFSEQTFKSNDATLVQLRNSGGYRLIQRDHISDSIALYDARVNNIYEQGTYYINSYKEIRSLLDEILDITVTEDSSFYKNRNLTEKLLPPLSADVQKLKVFFNKLVQLKIATYSYCNSPYYLRGHLLYAERLLALLKEEYGIE